MYLYASLPYPTLFNRNLQLKNYVNFPRKTPQQIKNKYALRLD